MTRTDTHDADTAVREPAADPAAAGGAPGRPGLVVTLGAAVGVLGAGLMVAAVVAPSGASIGLVLAMVALAVVAVALGLASPLVCVVYLLTATFFRQSLAGLPLPLDAFLLAFVGLLVAVVLWTRRHPEGSRPAGLLEAVIAVYLAWALGSYLAPHEFEAIYPEDGSPVYVFRFMLIGTMMPLFLLLVAQRALTRDRAVRLLTMCLMGFGAYAAYVSATQIYAQALVFPRYVVSNPDWPGRAVGVFNQPVVNGLVLVLGYLASMLVVTRREELPVVRVLAGAIGAATCVGVYLTHTRSAYLSLALVVLAGFVLARGWRTGFAVTGTVMLLGVAANWSQFSSSDRQAGGVGSTNEVLDRLNIAATSIWALGEKPLTGWGIGRFPSVNTYHHQSFSWQVPWNRGFGYASHFDALGVGAELGLVGLVLWLAIWGILGLRLLAAVRSLPVGRYDREFAVLASLCAISLLVTGLTVDLRFFDFPNFLTMMVVGAALGRAAQTSRARGRAEPDPVDRVGST